MVTKVKCKKALNIHSCRFKYGKIYDIISMLNLLHIETNDIKCASYIIIKDENLFNTQFVLDTSFVVEEFKKYFSLYDEQKIRDIKLKKIMKLIN